MAARRAFGASLLTRKSGSVQTRIQQSHGSLWRSAWVARSSSLAIKEQREQEFRALGISPYPRYTEPPAGHPLVSHAIVHSRWGQAMDSGAKLTNVQLTVQGRV
ncbi:hypothetical protein IWW36_005652, partial [Coemansia brasiliensis]